MNRRGMLTAVGVALSSSVTGCLDFDRVLGGGEDDFDPAIDSAARLGSAEQESIEAVPEREYEYDDGNDTVRITYDSGSTNEMPFDEWGTRRATATAVSHLGSLLDTEALRVEGISLGSGEVELSALDDPPSASAFERAISLGPVIRHTTLYSRDGTLLNRPEVEFAEIVGASPRSIEVTMQFAERDYTAVLPVLCRRGWMREQ